MEISNEIPNNYSAVSYLGKVPEVYKINLGFNLMISLKAIDGERQITIMIIEQDL